jgi:hypothetical protein
MKNSRVVKYWRTEPVNKKIDITSAAAACMWSGYHYSEEAAILFLQERFEEYQCDASGIEFEVLPYYVVEKH